MRSYLASLALKCKSFNKETIVGNTFLLLVLIVSNRIILRPSSVVGVRVSKLAPFSDLFFPPLSFLRLNFPPLGILVLGCDQSLRTILNGDEGLDLTHSWEYVMTCLLGKLLFFLLLFYYHFAIYVKFKHRI